MRAVAMPPRAEAGGGPAGAPAMEQEQQIATFGLGCFWGSERAMEGLGSAISTTVGYMGGIKRAQNFASDAFQRGVKASTPSKQIHPWQSLLAG